MSVNISGTIWPLCSLNLGMVYMC